MTRRPVRHTSVIRRNAMVVLVLGLLLPFFQATPVSAQACSVPRVQTHRGIQGTFDQCVDRTFSDGGTTYTVHVYYTETVNPADGGEHALADGDNASGDNTDAVLVAAETVAAWQFYRSRPNPVPIVSGTEMNVYIGEDARGGGVPTCNSLWWDDEWVDAGDVLTMRVLAYHESFHLAQGCQYPQATGSHGEGVARALEDRVDPGLDANLGNLFIPDFQSVVAIEGPGVLDASGNLPAPRARADSLDDQWYWSFAWWTYLFDRTEGATDVDPVRSWDAIDRMYDLMSSNATEVGAVNDLLAPQGSNFAEAFRRYGQALFVYRYAPADPQLGYPDVEIVTSTGPLSGHTIRNGNPAVQTSSFTMNPRSTRHFEVRPNASCPAVTFSFDGNGKSYGWAVLGVEDPLLVTQSESVGTTWSATVLVGDLDRIAGVVSSTGSSGTVDVEFGCTQPTVEVEDPTTATPAIVGEAADPRRLLARVDVDGPSGDPVQGLTADAFTVALRRAGSELPATVLSAAEVQSDYWLLLDLPNAAAGAQTGLSYDLVARVGGAQGAQTSSVLYAEQPDRDLLIVTDQSGSMATANKIEAARNAGELLVEELTDDDQASYTAFDEVAVVRQPLAPLGVGNHRDTVQNAIRAEVPSGATSIGAGMRAAASEEDLRGLTDNACAFVLLSDGAENTDPRWANVIAEVTDNGCPLHVVGLGPGANEPLLQQIAGAVPGGSYDYAGTGPGGGAFAEFAQAGGATTWQNGLAAVYDLLGTRVGGRERLLSTGFSVPPPSMACTREFRNVTFADAAPEQFSTGQQMTAGGVTFTSVPFVGESTGSAEITAGDEVFFNSLTLQADVPSCRVVMRVRVFNTTAELRVNGDSRVVSNLADLDGATIGGVTVDVQSLDTSSGFQTASIVLAGSLTSYGFGGTRTFGEFPGQVYLTDMGIQVGEVGGIPITVDPTSERLVVTASSQTPVAGALTQLYRPDGSPQPSSSSRREPHNSSEVWDVVAPPPGQWRLLVNSQFTSPGLVTASAVTDLTLQLLLQPTTELLDAAVTGLEIPLVAVFSGQGGPVLGADVRATVTDPSGFPVTVVMRDDGEHGDGASADGFYGGSYTATSFGDVTAPNPPDGAEPQVPGSYRVDVLGVSGADRREDSGAFALQQGADGDNDGLPDGYETAHGLDPANAADARSDVDRDGLDATCEFQAGTDPRNRDTDEGGAADGSEVTPGQPCRRGLTNPLDPADDRVSPIDSADARPEVDNAGNPVVVITWGDPVVDGHNLVDVTIWCQPVDRRTLEPTGPWVRIAAGVGGNTYTHRDVTGGQLLRYEVDPRVDGGGGPTDSSTQTTSPVPVGDDPYAPEGTILIDDGAATTRDVLVDLELTVDDVSSPGHDAAFAAGLAPATVPGSGPDDIEMRIGNGPHVLPGTPWEPFSSEVTDWELDPDGSGLGLVSVEFRDTAGNIGAGGLFMKDTIQVSGRRLQGPTRIETAVDISTSDFRPGTADAVVVARADIFPDALAGGPLAVDRRAPLLLTPRDSLHPATAAEITRVLLPGAPVYVLGGTAAITDATAEAIAALGYEIRRVAGATRIETAVEIARQLGSPDPLLLATGGDFVDPLIAAAAAPGLGGAVLLVADGRREPATDAYIQSRPGVTLYAIGQPAVSGYPEATPLAGTGPAETAVVVAEAFHTGPTLVGIARDDDFPDALAGGAHVARHGGPMLLSSRDSLSRASADYLCDNQATLGHVVAFGGVAALTDDVVDNAVARALGIGC